LTKKGRIILTLRNRFQDLEKKLENIITGCQQKDTRSQKELYDLLGGKMYGVCLRYAGNTDDANDILQDGFLKVFEKIHQFKFEGSFEGWLRRIFVNTALERYRGQYKIINIQDSWRELKEGSYENIVSSITVDELVGLIQELSPKYRAVFNLYAIEGYSHKEIADLLGVSEGTSKSNLSRARLILQEKVAQYYNTELKMQL
jgi:RNA polymerase sigma factor (sigma-70 family)